MICKIKLKRGYSLIETLIVIFIFLFILIVVFNIYISSIREQRYNLSAQQLIDETSYALEYIERFVRMAQKDISGSCVGTAGKNYQTNGNALIFKNYKGQCQMFSVYNGRIYQNLTDSSGAILGLNAYLTSAKFNVISFRASILGDDVGDFLQPRVSLYLEIEGKNMSPAPKMKIQATISQRNLDK